MNTAPYQCRFGTYNLAGPHDHAAVSHLLRSVPVQGDTRLSLRREPDFAAYRNPLGKSAMIIGRGTQGNPMFLCEMREYPVYIGGKPSKAVYLGPLRVAPEYRRHIGVLEHGFLAVRTFARRMELADDFFAAIPYDDIPARTIAEAGLARLPRYAMLGDIDSMLLPARSNRGAPEPSEGYSIDPGAPVDARDMEGLLAAAGAAWSYAPALSAGQLTALLGRERGSISFSDILMLRHNGLAVGCVGVWDQRGRRQQYVEGYSLGTSLLRIWYGLTGRKTPFLPSPGSRLELVYLPFFSIRHNHAKAGLVLLEHALRRAGARGGRVCALALAEQNPLHRSLGLKGQIRRVRIYRVIFPGSGKPSEGRLFAPQPELALL